MYYQGTVNFRKREQKKETKKKTENSLLKSCKCLKLKLLLSWGVFASINRGSHNTVFLADNSCSSIKKFFPAAESGNYDIDPDSEGGLAPFTVYCDMIEKNGVGVTVISHDSESTTKVRDGLGWGGPGSYRRDIHYTGASLSQLASLTSVSLHCEQFIKYECYHSMLGGYAWWVSRDSFKMNYWGGALPGSGKCACGMNNTCANPKQGCNCNKNDFVWHEDSGLLTDKTKLPVKRLVHGDAGNSNQGYHTLGKLKCYGIA